MSSIMQRRGEGRGGALPVGPAVPEATRHVALQPGITLQGTAHGAPHQTWSPLSPGAPLQRLLGGSSRSVLRTKLGKALSGRGMVAALQYEALCALRERPWSPTAPPAESARVPAMQLTAKDDVPPPAVGSTDVPDLPMDLVTEITAARNTAERQRVLDALLAYLSGAGIVDDPDKTLIKYVHRKTNTAAVTQAQGTEDDSPIQITVYRDAFRSPAILYSTVRHELIHVAQRLQVPDNPSQATDPYMYEDLYTTEGVNTRKTLQTYLQEIETYLWELDNSTKTGIDQAYVDETEEHLTFFVEQLTSSIKSKKIVPGYIYTYWSAYIHKAKDMVFDYQTTNQDLLAATTALVAAVAARG
jgi:hypothetical protein